MCVNRITELVSVDILERAGIKRRPSWPPSRITSRHCLYIKTHQNRVVLSSPTWSHCDRVVVTSAQ